MMQVNKLILRLPDIDINLAFQILEDAEAEILDFCNRSVLSKKMEPLQRELAIIYYNRMGSEGESSRSEGGVSVSYSTEIPESLKARLISYRRLKAVGIANENKR
ncbi:phage head-tail connector protein [Clostridium perfringens]|uniref:phage head-tail connector protein n=1 Tax=Clostridium perfringens TaxID=1502 RepID=UPI0009D74F0E|nr:phage head-tail connector protein [Clostridium perfringens]